MEGSNCVINTTMSLDNQLKPTEKRTTAQISSGNFVAGTMFSLLREIRGSAYSVGDRFMLIDEEDCSKPNILRLGGIGETFFIDPKGNPLKIEAGDILIDSIFGLVESETPKDEPSVSVTFSEETPPSYVGKEEFKSFKEGLASVLTEISKTNATEERGERGTRGFQGIQGDRGEVGQQGLLGEQGNTGEKGDVGDVGPKGDKGEQGDKGEEGQQGIVGSRGIQGIQGIVGSQGIQGIQGIAGVKGEKGEQGTQGIVGPTGDRGQRGDPGERGLVGDIGPVGLTGKSGRDGEKGVQGNSGKIGKAGAKGAKGEKGNKGSTGESGVLTAKFPLVYDAKEKSVSIDEERLNRILQKILGGQKVSPQDMGWFASTGGGGKVAVLHNGVRVTPDVRSFDFTDHIQVTKLAGKITINVIDGKGSGLDADLLHGFPGTCITTNLPTGIVYGGILGGVGSETHFTISAGLGHIHDPGASLSADVNPSYQGVTWATQTVALGSTTGNATYVFVNANGTIGQQSETFTNTQEMSSIIIGRLGHPGGRILAASPAPNTTYSTDLQYRQFIRIFGPMKMAGCVISGTATGLKINRTAGAAYALGRNYSIDPENPSRIELPAIVAGNTYGTFYRSATTGQFIINTTGTAISPQLYDTGSGVPVTIPSAQKWTIQRLFQFVNVPDVIVVYYGRVIYGSSSEAINTIEHEEFTEDITSAENSIFLGYLVVKKEATDLTDTTQAVFVQAGLMRNTVGGGGAAGAVGALNDLTDVTLTSPSNNQLLQYNGSEWVNATVASGVGATGATGATGAGGALGYYGSFSDTTDQGLTLANTIYSMKFNTNEGSNGVSIGSPTSRIVIANTGIYDFQFSSQFTNSGGSERIVSIWVRINGVDVVRSASHVSVSGNDQEIAAWNFVLPMTAGDYFELMMSSDGTTVVMEAIPEDTNPTRPLVPSVILTATQVMYTQLPNNYLQTYNGLTGDVHGISLLQGKTGAFKLHGGAGVCGSIITSNSSGTTYQVQLDFLHGGTTMLTTQKVDSTDIFVLQRISGGIERMHTIEGKFLLGELIGGTYDP